VKAARAPKSRSFRRELRLSEVSMPFGIGLYASAMLVAAMIGG
jgi:hypothetical protein